MRKPSLFLRGTLAATFAVLASPLASAQFADDLVAYWPLDGDTADATATGADGTFVPGTGLDQTERYAAAQFGDGIDLNNFAAQAFDQYIEITGVPDGTFDFAGSMSISLWASSPFLSIDNQTLVAKGQGTSWSLERDDANLSVAMLGGGSSAADDPLADLFGDLGMHHIVGVVEAGAGITLYLDGQVVGSTSGNVQIGDSPFNLAIGANPAAAPAFRTWEGVIDDIGVWSRVLSPAEVSAIYNGGTGVSIANLLNPVDTDSDGMPDYYENSNGLDPEVDDAGADLDGDGRTNLQEFEDGTDPNNSDTDGDGLNDGEEAAAGTSPTNPDTDGDKIPDPDEINGNTNPFLGGVLREPFDPQSDPAGDPTDPLMADSDGDTFDDKTEITFGSNPNDPSEAPSTWQIGLLGYWPLDRASFEASDADPASRFFPDASGLGRKAVWDGSSTTPAWFSGNQGSSVARINATAGEQYITIQNSESALSGAGGDLSISIWIRSVGFTKEFQTIAAKGEGNNWRIHRWGSSSPGVASYGGGTADIPGSATGPRIDDFKWHHVVAVTENGVATRLYVDAELIAISPEAPALVDNGVPVRLGSNPDAAGREYVGLMEEVAMWGRVLSPGEITQIYLNGSGATISDLILGLDTDDDGLPDTFENAYGLDPNDSTGENGADGDPDGDGLTNLQEKIASTNPSAADTDGDGLDDSEEITIGSDPLVVDTDRDTISDGDEVAGTRNPTLNGVIRDPFDPNTDPPGDPTSPLLANTDGDRFDDALEMSKFSDPNDPDSTPDLTIITVLGTGTGALLGGDLTDPEDDGNDVRNPLTATDGLPERGWNFIGAVANEKSSFSDHEAAFNIFDNRLGPAQDKWCCNARHITVEFEEAYQLTHFTVSSANDVPTRDWRIWRILGSEDGANGTFEVIHEELGEERLWPLRLQVVQFVLGRATPPYRFFRLEADTNWGNNLWQVGEVELFGVLPGVEGPPAPILDVAGSAYNAATQELEINITNVAAGETYHLRSSTDGETFTPLTPGFDFDDSTAFPATIPVDIGAEETLILQIFEGASP